MTAIPTACMCLIVLYVGGHNKESMYIHNTDGLGSLSTSFDLKLGDLQVEQEGMGKPLYIFAELLWGARRYSSDG